MRKRIGVLAGAILTLCLVAIEFWECRRDVDALPRWDWGTSQILLTQPMSFCGPILAAPGILRRAELLGWRIATDTAHAVEIRDVLLWGQFETPNKERRWVITAGRQGANRTDWSHDYVCDGHETRYRVFEQMPRSADLRLLTLSLFQPVDTSWTSQLQIRRSTWRQVLRDPPSLATSAFP